MHIPFIPRDEAKALLEDAYHAEEARSEMLAEMGSSYFYGGMQSNGGYDALSMACMDLNQMEEDFRSSEEGEIYYARLEAARLYNHNLALSAWSIPEFVDGKTSWAHSPLGPPSRFTPSDDIPF